MIFGKWTKFGIVLVIITFVIGHLGCDRTQSLLTPADTIVPLSPEMSQTLIEDGWRVTSIDGTEISDSILQMQTLVTKYVSSDIQISFSDTSINTILYLKADGTWELSVYYDLSCELVPNLLPGDVMVPFTSPAETASVVSVDLSVSGTYLAGFDTEKQAHVLVFETEKYTRNTIEHENPYNEIYVCPDFAEPGYSCPATIIYPAFTADLDWSIFDEAPLSKLFSSPLFDTQSGNLVVYTWDMVTSEGTVEDYWSERGYGVSGDIVLGPLVGYTLQLYSQEKEDIVLRRTEESVN